MLYYCKLVCLKYAATCILVKVLRVRLELTHMESITRLHSMSKCHSLSGNIRYRWKRLTLKNTLIYKFKDLNTTVKKLKLCFPLSEVNTNSIQYLHWNEKELSGQIRANEKKIVRSGRHHRRGLGAIIITLFIAVINSVM